MTDREYVFRTSKGGWSAPVGLPRHMNAARKRVVDRDGPFKLTQDGDPLSRQVKRATVLARYQTAIENRELGATFRIRKRNDDVVFTGRSSIERPDSIDINGNAKSDEFWTWVVNEFPEYRPRFGGSYVCRTIAGSSQLSQHSYGNGVDVFFDSITHQEAVFNAVVNGRAPVPVAHAISLSRIWEPGSGIHYYTGERHYHLHTDYAPNFSGPCGVRG
jgi:hypothetical protein